jgi:hypothetical protein
VSRPHPCMRLLLSELGRLAPPSRCCCGRSLTLLIPYPAALGMAHLCRYAHRRGLWVVLFTAVYRRFGIPGFFALPVASVAIEKSAYDTALSLCGKSPTVVRPERANEGFPAGGMKHMPNLSLIPVVDWAKLTNPCPAEAAAAAAHATPSESR